ncbi:6-pyruvoyl-tetrahydropterin synthase-related protein [Helicovermis profundi]|uniref:6-carboxy-5,6,7,8-tetrahydropterin synthase n=1 Tax=Helicovermis profundi TaxID=3065157 RepID=A0AAU9E7T1_9FIRM|nr:hypothetical protein HLPR_01230 [Clostridia bacterium S502]
MLSRSYKFKFYLNAKHFLYIDNKKSLVHPHTWELTFFLVKENTEFIQFTDLEKIISNYLLKYESRIINEVKPFDSIVPTMEAIGEIIYTDISKSIQKYSFSLLKLEISENSARTYIINNEMHNFKGFNPIKEELNDLNQKYTLIKKSIETISSHNDNDNINKVKKTTILKESETTNQENLRKLIKEIIDNSITKIDNTISHDDNKLSNEIKSINTSSIVNEPQKLQAQTIYSDLAPNNHDELSSSKNILPTIDPPIESSKTNTQSNTNELTNSLALLNNRLSKITELAETTNKLSVDNTKKLEEVINKNINSSYSKETSKNEKKLSNKKKLISTNVLSVLILVLSYLAIFYFLFKNGSSPWGSDTYGHLFKSHFLYTRFINGDVFPLFTKLWYNGIQPFRYWAPSTYYVLLIGELISKGNSIFSFYFFTSLVFFIGAIPWILYGKHNNKIILGTILGVLWFILPDNYRVLFGEGNLPRVVVTTLFPYILINIFYYLDYRKKIQLIYIFILMFFITLTHAMIAALVGITIFLFLFIDVFSSKKYLEAMHILFSSVLGIVSASFWLYPALKGGIISLNSSTNLTVMQQLTYKISQSLNPFFRLGPSLSDSYYFGLSAVLISLIAIIIAKGKIKTSFLMVIIIFLGTTKWFLFILKKLPLSQLFWMMRFTPLAMAFLLIAILSFKKLKKKYVFFIVLVLLIEGIFTMSIIQVAQENHRAYESLNYATSIASQRIGVLDLSTFDSDPSYYSSYTNKNKEISQIFGWAWQGATTSENIVWLNYALEKGYYNYIFDRSLEMGADTLLIRKKYIEDLNRLTISANKLGYKLKYVDDDAYIFKYPIDTTFATKVNYEILGIGSYANNLIFAFPTIKIGNYNSIDEYTLDELSKYKKIILSGFDYNDKSIAENKIKKLSDLGVEIYIDLTHSKTNMLSQRSEFLDVIAQPINLHYTFPNIDYNGENYLFNDFNSNDINWNTNYLVNLDKELGISQIDDKTIVFYGTKYNNNIKFVGLNLFYYSYTKRDPQVLKLLENILGLKAEDTPKRIVVPITKKRVGNTIQINAPKGTLSDIAYLDSFKTKQATQKIHNLIYLVEGNTNLDIVYPYFNKGLLLSMIGLLIFLIYINKYKQINYLYTKYSNILIERNNTIVK